MNANKFDVVIIGGGIVGVATAFNLLQKKKLKLCLLEKEAVLAKHQTGNNSGVIHSGLYYKPGSVKAKNCIEGRELLYKFCEENNIKFERCGKIVVATSKDEIPILDDLLVRGSANGLVNIKKISSEEILEYEPHVKGVMGLKINETGIVDFKEVTNCLGKKILENDCSIFFNSKLLKVINYDTEIILETTSGEYRTKILVNCAGLYSDKIANMSGVNAGVKIIPFRGEYYCLKKEKEYLVNHLIYPVPDPRFPFLGVHFTRMIKGGVEAGPNAVLAFKREGYSKSDFSLDEFGEMVTFPGFWKMVKKYYKMGYYEFKRSLLKNEFVAALQKLIPEITSDDIEKGGAGVRAQALDMNGKLLDDFFIKETENMVHVLNAPSPAATAALSIGNKISDIVVKKINAS
ncbi:MAG: L-2-hydroxyglutarate oxidase [Chlorobiaceae bacterium]|nr:L-2-hydroxyglutarate oxidase [Chlorobiaceae bacterium]